MAEKHYPNMSNAEAFLRLWTHQDKNQPPKRLLFMGEEHWSFDDGKLVPHLENAGAYVAALQAGNLAAPDGKQAVFLELPPEIKHPVTGQPIKLQAEVDEYLATGKAPEHLEVLELHFDVIKEARRTGAAVFLIDDRESADQVTEAQKLGAGSFQKLMDTLPKRNEVMAERIASILNGTNNEPIYEAQRQKGEIDQAIVINGTLHLAGVDDLNEMTIRKLAGNKKFTAGAAFSIELFVSKDGARVINNPDGHYTPVLSKVSENPLVSAATGITNHSNMNASINLEEHTIYAKSIRGLDSDIEYLKWLARKTPEEKDDAAIKELEGIVDEFKLAPSHHGSQAKSLGEIDKIANLPEEAKFAIESIKKNMSELCKYEAIQEFYQRDAVNRVLPANNPSTPTR